MEEYFLILFLLISTCSSHSSNESDSHLSNGFRISNNDFHNSHDIRYQSYFGRTDDFQTRIIGGKKISVFRAPYQVSLQWYNYHFCGGTLYSRNMVVTAAHCVARKMSDDLFVRVGSSRSNDGGRLYGVMGMAVHPKYNREISSYDIAVLRLEDCVTLSHRVKTIELARLEPRENESVLVTGFGRTKYNDFNEDLMAVNVSIISRRKCAKVFGKKYISDVNICADAFGKDACQGDSGGPLVYNNKLIGVVSWGKGCATPNFPGVYSNVPALRGWVRHVVNQLNEL